MAEALVRLDRGAEAAAAAAEAAEVFTRLNRPADVARAHYWLAGAEYELENSAEARNLLGSILASVRAGLAVEPRFQLRVLMALAAVEARDGDHGSALAYLEEVRALEGTLDDRRRATFLFDLAQSYRETGDIEAAIRTGHQGLSLFRALEAEAEEGALENELALAYISVPNTARAAEFAALARTRFERLRDDRWLAHVIDTQARIALADGNPSRALELAAEALALAEQTDNAKALIDALLTTARAEAALGRLDDAGASCERAAELARAGARPGRLREVLGEWADVLALLGDHRRAYEISREALRAG
jgi:tetratricopeptide (TPR) repeat protein